jgi:hypothetical protein
MRPTGRVETPNCRRRPSAGSGSVGVVGMMVMAIILVTRLMLVAVRMRGLAGAVEQPPGFTRRHVADDLGAGHELVGHAFS